ncbi:hypothetical protein MAPG_04953 [Magnaporthiopsis poae ATCC 64411]|uniref:DUF7888 domain-containing protein n=1 Tax=Magnaporthiopsis poae (strain ATCC 64411 / 73-15) TaxID=644358 RepID=A0A0C4DY44_MAGP6|nr:hypothetical protein MAPG_04953 [Magnaporthiopsis poae ATCC 64411]
MQFKNIFVLALPVAVLAAPFVAPTTDAAAVSSDLVAREPMPEYQLEVRDPQGEDLKQQLIAIVVSAAKDIVKDAATAIAAAAVKGANKVIQSVKNWTPAREAFTQATAKEMWDKNPDPKKYAAAICYNMDYSVSNPMGMAGLVKAELRSSFLHTDYDCFFMSGNNTMKLKGDGGYINLAFESDKRCTYNRDAKYIRC